jgi:hypothetical protein
MNNININIIFYIITNGALDYQTQEVIPSNMSRCYRSDIFRRNVQQK